MLAAFTIGKGLGGRALSGGIALWGKHHPLGPGTLALTGGIALWGEHHHLGPGSFAFTGGIALWCLGTDQSLDAFLFGGEEASPIGVWEQLTHWRSCPLGPCLRPLIQL